MLYCMSDSEFMLNGISSYYWVLTYFVLITFEMTYGKKLTSSVKMESVWGPVLYCNLLAALPMFLIGYFNGDYENIAVKLQEVPANGVMILVFSCVAGTLIGWVTCNTHITCSASLFNAVSSILACLLARSDTLVGCAEAWCPPPPTRWSAW